MDLIKFNIKIMWKIKNIGKNVTKKVIFSTLCWIFIESLLRPSIEVDWDLESNQQANNLSYKAPENPKLLK